LFVLFARLIDEEMKKEVQYMDELKDINIVLDPDNNLIGSPEFTNAIILDDKDFDNIYHLLSDLSKFDKVLLALPKFGAVVVFVHSPYTLFSINNCIMKYIVTNLVKDKMPEENQKKWFKADFPAIDPKKIHIWEAEYDKLEAYEMKLPRKFKIIQQFDGLLGDNVFDRRMKYIMDDFDAMLNYYDEYETE
jgi:hypothetical protein